MFEIPECSTASQVSIVPGEKTEDPSLLKNSESIPEKFLPRVPDKRCCSREKQNEGRSKRLSWYYFDGYALILTGNKEYKKTKKKTLMHPARSK